MKFFGELEVWEKFTFILWKQGEVEFTKITEKTATRDSTQEVYSFNYNDLVKVVA